MKLNIKAVNTATRTSITGVLFFYVCHYDVKLACACPNMKSMLSYRRYTPLNVKKLCAKRSYHAHILPHHKGQLLRR